MGAGGVRPGDFIQADRGDLVETAQETVEGLLIRVFPARASEAPGEVVEGHPEEGLHREDTVAVGIMWVLEDSARTEGAGAVGGECMRR